MGFSVGNDKGSDPVDGLHILNLVQVSRGTEEFSDYLSEYLDVSDHPSLSLGEEHCYEAHLTIDPVEEGRYRDLVKVIVSKPQTDEQNGRLLSQAGPIEFALELTTDFSLLDPPAPSPTTTPTALPATATPTATTAAPTVTPSPSAENTKFPTATPQTLSFPTATPQTLRATPTGAPAEMPTPTPAGALPTEAPEPSQLPPPGGSCVYPPSYWLEHPESWPIDVINLGIQEVNRQTALDLLAEDPREDASLKLAQALVVAKLNAYHGADWQGVADEIGEADDWFFDHPAGSLLTGMEAEYVEGLAESLKLFNLGLSGPESCMAATTTSTPLPSYTATVPAPTPIPSSTIAPAAAEPETPIPVVATPTPTTELTSDPTSTPTTVPGLDPDMLGSGPAPTPTDPPTEPALGAAPAPIPTPFDIPAESLQVEELTSSETPSQ